MQMSKTSKILNHLLTKKSITNWECIQLYHDTRLSDKIYKFKKIGYKFTSEWKCANDGTRYKIYYLIGVPNGKSDEMQKL